MKQALYYRHVLASVGVVLGVKGSGRRGGAERMLDHGHGADALARLQLQHPFHQVHEMSHLLALLHVCYLNAATTQGSI